MRLLLPGFCPVFLGLLGSGKRLLLLLFCKKLSAGPYGYSLLMYSVLQAPQRCLALPGKCMQSQFWLNTAAMLQTACILGLSVYSHGVHACTLLNTDADAGITHLQS